MRQEADALMDMPNEAQRRISQDKIVWLTTITDRGVPAPNPVWFVADGDDLVVFSTPQARKVRNIEQRPTVTLHFNSDPTAGTSSSSPARRRSHAASDRARSAPTSTSTNPASRGPWA
jgi:PPOX class probable F420-dependent enzyme